MKILGEKQVKKGTDGQSSFHRAWEALFPYLLYYLAFNAAYLIMAFAYQAAATYMGVGDGQFMAEHAAAVSGVAEGICRLFAILPLLSMLKRELLWRRESRGPGAAKEAGAGAETGGRMEAGRWVKTGIFTVVFAVCASLGLNVLFALTGFAEASAAYQEVAKRQYGVAFGVGLLLYGVVSPLAEEVVFRGVIYNRMRRLFGRAVGIVASGLLFGVMHGNLVQGVYGACMGMLMAYVYERQDSFFWPVLFHAAANLTVYGTAYAAGLQEALFTPAGCVGLLAVAVLCVGWREVTEKR